MIREILAWQVRVGWGGWAFVAVAVVETGKPLSLPTDPTPDGSIHNNPIARDLVLTVAPVIFFK